MNSEKKITNLLKTNAYTNNLLVFPSMKFVLIYHLGEKCDSEEAMITVLIDHAGGTRHNHICQMLIF